MSPVLTLTAFYGDSGQAQNTDEQTITATGLRKKGDCFTARVSSGQAQRLTVSHQVVFLKSANTNVHSQCS